MNIEVKEVSWAEQEQALSQIRREVFIEEQHVPEELEWDGLDPDCRHVLAVDQDSGVPIGTGRLVADGQLGRMAVAKDYRRQGIGHKILQLLLDIARRDGHTQVYLHAQLTAVEFYQLAKFVASGDTFMDAGIPHINMSRVL
ncbi:MAG: GNAT family N-acetyltransferase [Gammaproteobacteria bacterium]|nr:GNAT family N-acetyltransferase [Gammaproteobacteria bacterium]MDH5776708.1 GNAT family N-acetyltransferase [Gammaproteobacteria bacterium]